MLSLRDCPLTSSPPLAVPAGSPPRPGRSQRWYVYKRGYDRAKTKPKHGGKKRRPLDPLHYGVDGSAAKEPLMAFGKSDLMHQKRDVVVTPRA